jgi:chromosomal replication initiation ATPase DnaA
MTLLESLHKPCRLKRKPPLHDDTSRICRMLQTAVAASFAVPVDALRAPSRCRADVAFARQTSMYLAHVVLGLSYCETGAAFRRDRTTAAHACRLVEERRDDPELDRLLHVLEEICCDLARGRLTLTQVRL